MNNFSIFSADGDEEFDEEEESENGDASLADGKFHMSYIQMRCDATNHITCRMGTSFKI